MTQQESTNPRPSLTRTGEVEVRQHVILPSNGSAAVYRVEQLLNYPDTEGHTMVLLTLVPVGGGTPQVERRWTEAPIELATDDQVAEAIESTHRVRIAAGLRELAEQIEAQKMRFRSWYGVSVSSSLPDGEVSRLAELLGEELKSYGSEQKRLTWSLRQSDAGDGVTVSFTGKPAPEPQPQPEHYHAAGAGGEAGACAAVCACGVTFAGFDSIAEAVVELDKHIADPEPEQEWLFTFGSGQQHDGRFVRITGTHDSARARMVEVFGTAWCDQYTWQSFDAAGLPSRLTELTGPEWLADALTAGE
jgi:hypothetical protein